MPGLRFAARTIVPRRPRSCRVGNHKHVTYFSARTTNVSSTAPDTSSTSSALNREVAEDHYIDLRTLKKVGWNSVRKAEASAPGCNFGPFESASAVAALSDDILFGPDTLRLSQSQRSVVRALLSRKSVLFSALVPGKECLVLDLTLRAREWNETIVYCAPTDRAAKAMYMAITSHVLSKKCICLEIGSQRHPSADSHGKKYSLVITVPRVFRRALVDSVSFTWAASSDLVIFDDLLSSGIPEWEEIILNIPRRVLLCILASDLRDYERDEFPLWLEAVQNCVVPIALGGGLHLWDRVDRSTEMPNLRAFIYNAAVHSCPIQISLPLIAKELEKDLELSQMSTFHSSSPSRAGYEKRKRNLAARENGVANPMGKALLGERIDYESALLRGVEVIPAEDVNSLAFDCRDHAEFADVASLIVADAKQSTANLSDKNRNRKQSVGSGRKKIALMSGAAAMRRRLRQECSLLPALVFVHGRRESEAAAGAILASLDELHLDVTYDSDSREYLTQIVDEFRVEHSAVFPQQDDQILGFIECGVGIIHDGVLPALQFLAQELFNDGLIAVLVVDTHLGLRDIASLPLARSVLVQSSALAESNDGHKGLIKGASLGKLAGRPGIDDVGNVVALWFDESVTDTEASGDAAFSILGEELRSKVAPLCTGATLAKIPISPIVELLDPRHPATILPGYLPYIPSRRRSGTFCPVYSGVLGTLRCHDNGDVRSVFESTLDSHRSWLAQAAVRATREKLEVELRAIEDHLVNVDWDELALHDRREAKLSEQLRLYETMLARHKGVASQFLVEELKVTPPGTIIGLRAKTGMISGTSISQRVLSGETGINGVSEDSVDDGGVTEKEVNVNLREEGDLRSSGAASGSSHSETNSMQSDVGKDSALSLVPAVMVDVFDNSTGNTQSSVLKSDIVVACILVDGMWTLVPVESVAAIGTEESKIANVDLLSAPHLATFDLDPLTQWAKCKPYSESDIARVSLVSDKLIEVATAINGDSIRLKPFELPELQKQGARVSSARKLHEESPWYGREAEMADLRRLRRRMAKLGDDIESVMQSEQRIESRQQQAREEFRSRLRALLAVMEDCNAIAVAGETTLDMTPIGVLASVFPGLHPLFSAACMLLVNGVDELSPASLAAFVAVTISSPENVLQRNGRQRSTTFTSESKNMQTEGDAGILENGDQPINGDLNGYSRNLKGIVRDIDDLDGVLPVSLVQEMEQVMKALRIVQTRHFNTEALSALTPRISPDRLDTSTARAIHHFVEGVWSWKDVVENSDKESGHIVEEFRRCMDALDVISRDEAALGELTDLQTTISEARRCLTVWPLVDVGDISFLSKFNIGSRRYGSTGKNTSYKSWWGRAIQDVELALSEAEQTIENVAAEVVNSSDDR